MEFLTSADENPAGYTCYKYCIIQNTVIKIIFKIKLHVNIKLDYQRTRDNNGAHEKIRQLNQSKKLNRAGLYV